MPTLYIDDSTGTYYTWDGSKFVRFSNDSPVNIGDQGDKAFQDQEKKERQAIIDQETKDDGGNQDSKDKSADSTKARVSRIKNAMSNPNTASGMESDIVRASQKERERRKKAARRNADQYNNSSGKGKADIKAFKKDFSKFIANEVAEVEIEDPSWSRKNRRYISSPFIMPGTRREILNGPVPTVRVYFDHSGSWDEDKIAVGKQVIEAITSEYVAKKKLILEVLYFGNQVSENPDDTGGGTKGTPIMEDIKKYKPDNVIIMTDSDIHDITTITKVKGGVFLLFKGGVSINLQQSIKGRKFTRSYEII